MTRKRPALLLLAIAACAEPPTLPMTATARAVRADSGSTITEYVPPHPIRAVWERPPTSAMLESWDRAARRWSRILIPSFVGPVVVSEDSPCAEIFGVGTKLEPLTIAILDGGPDRRVVAASPCVQGVSGQIVVRSDWWERGLDPDEPYNMENTLVHEIGHILGIGMGWKFLDDDGRVIQRGGWWGGRVKTVRSTVSKGSGSPPDTVEWPYLDDPDIAETLASLTKGEWDGKMVPLNIGEIHWHGCLAPPVGCRNPHPNGCEGVKYGGDVMGSAGGITMLTLRALDPSLWHWIPSAAEPYGEPSDDYWLWFWRTFGLSRCPRPL